MYDDLKNPPCDHLEVILKTVERCNLNCSYCYFFQGGDQSYKKNPPFISEDTCIAVADFIAKGCVDLSIKTVNINLHGGEPLLQRTQQFDKMCSLFRSVLGPLTQLRLLVQTNGTLITPEWIDLFYKHHIEVGVSCDGPPEYHDRYRIDHRGHGSHAKMVEGIQQLKQAATDGKIKPIGLLCVIDPTRCPKRIYNHFRHDLDVESMDFLLPDETHDTFNADPLAFGNFLCGMFNVWEEEKNPNVNVRFINRAIKNLSMSVVQFGKLRAVEERYREFTISSNGNLGSIDVLRSASPGWMWNGDHISTTSLAEFLKQPLFKKLYEGLNELPKKCHTCCWKNICRGGYMINRFSKESHFSNPTVYCEDLRKFYSHVTAYLLKHNMSRSNLEELLCHSL